MELLQQRSLRRANQIDNQTIFSVNTVPHENLNIRNETYKK